MSDELEITAEGLKDMPLQMIAKTILTDWSGRGAGVHPHAAPYLTALLTMPSVHSYYGVDSGETVVRYFLSNARSWRGPVAKLVKAELNRRVK